MREVILGATLALSLSMPAMAQQIFFDDFSAGNDAQWARVDPIGGSSYAVSGGRYQMSSGALPPLTATAAFGSFIADSFPSAPQYTNGTLRTSIILDNGATNAFVVARTNADATLGYVFSLNNANPTSNFFGIGFIGNPTNAATMQMPILDGVEYILEASFFGPDLLLKVWAADGPEPALPQVVWSDTTFASGHVGLGLYNQPSGFGGVGGALSGSFDNVSFTIPAPGAVALATLAGGLALRRRRSSTSLRLS